MERRKRKGDTENGKLCKAGGEALGERGEGGSEVVGDGERGGWEGSPDLGDTGELAQGQQEGRKFPVTGRRTALSTLGCCHRRAGLQPGLPRAGLGDARPGHGGCILRPEPCHAGRCSETGPTVTYFRGVLRTSVTMAMRLRANIMGFFWSRFLLLINHKKRTDVPRC